MWKKKIEKELQDGARTKDIYERERMNTDAERKVTISMPAYRLLHFVNIDPQNELCTLLLFLICLPQASEAQLRCYRQRSRRCSGGERIASRSGSSENANRSSFPGTEQLPRLQNSRERKTRWAAPTHDMQGGSPLL